MHPVQPQARAPGLPGRPDRVLRRVPGGHARACGTPSPSSATAPTRARSRRAAPGRLRRSPRWCMGPRHTAGPGGALRVLHRRLRRRAALPAPLRHRDAALLLQPAAPPRARPALHATPLKVHAVLRREGSEWIPVVGTPLGAENLDETRQLVRQAARRARPCARRHRPGWPPVAAAAMLRAIHARRPRQHPRPQAQRAARTCATPTAAASRRTRSSARSWPATSPRSRRETNRQVGVLLDRKGDVE